jgi:hypothetical protein
MEVIMINQLSILSENKKGAMNKITSILRENNIDIISLLTNDSGEFGIARMLVSDPESAMKALTKAGFLVRKDRVIGVYMENKCGSLDSLLDEISKSNINIDYIYISYDRATAAPIAIMHTDGSSEVEECLRYKGCKLL